MIFKNYLMITIWCFTNLAYAGSCPYNIDTYEAGEYKEGGTWEKIVKYECGTAGFCEGGTRNDIKDEEKSRINCFVDLNNHRSCTDFTLYTVVCNFKERTSGAFLIKTTRDLIPTKKNDKWLHIKDYKP